MVFEGAHAATDAEIEAATVIAWHFGAGDITVSVIAGELRLSGCEELRDVDCERLKQEILENSDVWTFSRYE